LLACLFMLYLAVSKARRATDFTFGLPLRCTSQCTCWMANYVDVDPSSGAHDFRGHVDSSIFSLVLDCQANLCKLMSKNLTVLQAWRLILKTTH
jgi:hypothetical protein